jgi:fatty-acyl-CoA synthase
MLVNCSEPVRAESQELLLSKLAPHGLRRTALAASYAMAEATFAVTQTLPNEGPVLRVVSRKALESGEARPATPGELTRTCVSSGVVIEGCAIQVVDDAGNSLPDGRVGELWVRSVSQFDGYRNRPELTALVLQSGWYHTGDNGFRDDGNWFVVGRKKDLIIVAGKNLYPEDIEDAINEVPGVLPGRVVAFGREDALSGTERVAVVLETRDDSSDYPELRRRVVAAVQLIDVTVSDVYLVPPRWLIKSSSGKPSRAANCQRVLTELVEGKRE